MESLRRAVEWTQVSDRQVAQDRTATYIVLYMSSGLLAVGGLFMSFSWMQILFFSLAVANFSLAHAAHHGTTSRMYYFDDESPSARNVAFAAFGVAQVARWQTALHMLPVDSPVTSLLYFTEYATLGSYAVYILARRNSSKFRVSTVMAFIWASTMILGAALYYAHTQRTAAYSIKYKHHVNETRLLYSAISQFLMAGLLHPGGQFLPAWVLEGIHVLLMGVLWACAGHKHLLHIG